MKYIWSITGRKISVFLILALPLTLEAQSDPWQAWDADAIRSLNTAVREEYLNDEEKKVILFMNMARHDGPLFSDSFLENHILENRLENSSYIRSLKRDLKKVRGLTPFTSKRDLTAIAQEHARNTGEKGSTGHEGFKNRFEPLMGNPYVHVGENCSYGYERALDIVISLLIDEGVKTLGHRNNILATDFNSVGVAIRPHKTYRVTCVMDFGATERSNMKEIP